MEQNYSLMAQSRANYYTAGSPVQFVRVELLKGDVNGEVAVCLTFKNVGTEPLTGLVVHFKCKDAAGQVLCEDDFYYEQLDAQPGDVFGSDEAVYVSDTPVSSVEVEQDRAFLNGRGVDLRGYKRVRLNAPRVLPASIAHNLQQRTGNPLLTCVPQDVEQGWFCACGAFHPNEENTKVCSECGGNRALIKSELTAILEEARQAAERQQQELKAVANDVTPAKDPAAMAAAAQAAISQQIDPVQQDEGGSTAAFDPKAFAAARRPQPAPAAPVEEDDEDEEAERVQRYAPKGRLFDDDDDESSTQMYDTDKVDGYDDEDDIHDAPAAKRGRYADEDEISEDDEMAERIIRWAPPITTVVCALIIAVSLIYRFVLA